MTPQGGVVELGGQQIVGIADGLPAGLADFVLAGLERAEDRGGGVDASVDHVVCLLIGILNPPGVNPNFFRRSLFGFR
jgi:hypothetical protein